MISKVDDFLANLKKKENIISYLKTIYKNEVGEDPIIPDVYVDGGMRLETFHTEADLEETQFATFKEKINSLKLPEVNDKDIKAKIAKMKKEKSPLLVKEVNMANYWDKGFNLELFKKFIEGMKILKSVEVLNLRNNGIDDTFIDNLVEVFNIDGLKRIDLSFNHIQKNAAKKLYGAIKTSKGLEYFDCSYNPFCQDEFICQQIMLSLKSHPNLYHVGISDCTRDAVLRTVNSLPNLRSLNLDDCKYKGKSFEQLCKVLNDKKTNIAELTLRFVNIDTLNSPIFGRIIRTNKTLVYLNLYGCNLSDTAGYWIIKEIENNRTMISINLGFNNLANEFCAALGANLSKNNTLTTIVLTKNLLINNSNFIHILENLVFNQFITSLGDLSETKVGVKFRESTDLILNMNKRFLYAETEELTKKEKMNEKNNFLRVSMENTNKYVGELDLKENIEAIEKFEIEQKEKEEREKQEKIRRDKAKPRQLTELEIKQQENEEKEKKEKELKVKREREDLEIQITLAMTKFEINLQAEELEDFQYFNSHLLP